MSYQKIVPRFEQTNTPLPELDLDRDSGCQGQDTNIFFAAEHVSSPAQKARLNEIALAFCRDCNVVDQCLKAAFEYDEQYGVWGGQTSVERVSSLNRANRPVPKLYDESED